VPLLAVSGLGEMGRSDRQQAWPAWPLPLLAGLLPFIATVVAYTLSIRLGLIEPCNPLVEGCVSISRAARHDLPNYLFRALVMPAAVLQALCWLLCGVFLRGRGAASTWRLQALPWIGLLSALFLVLYGTFLGTEGPAYRWMRRYGVVVYFGGTCLAMLMASAAAQRLTVRPHVVERVMVVLAASLPAMGLVQGFSQLLPVGEPAQAALQNRAEWWGGFLMTMYFVGMAQLWRVSGFEVRAVLNSADEDLWCATKHTETPPRGGRTMIAPSGVTDLVAQRSVQGRIRPRTRTRTRRRTRRRCSPHRRATSRTSG
jgi:hypothetical protein